MKKSKKLVRMGDVRRVPKKPPATAYDIFTCVHQLAVKKNGLCPICDDLCSTDPVEWSRYGNHPRGIAARKAKETTGAEYPKATAAHPNQSQDHARPDADLQV